MQIAAHVGCLRTSVRTRTLEQVWDTIENRFGLGHRALIWCRADGFLVSSNEAKPATNIEKKKQKNDEIDHVARTPMTIHSIHLCVRSSRHFGLGNTTFNQIK